MNARSWHLVLCYGLFGFGYIIPATFLPVMARQAVADPAVFGWAWPVFGATAALSTVFAARGALRFSHRSVWISGHLVMALGVLLPLLLPGFLGTMTAGVLVGGTFMVVTMAGMQEARRVSADGARPLMAAMTSAFALGQIVGPLLLSFLEVNDALLAAAALLAISAFVLMETRNDPIGAHASAGCRKDDRGAA